MNTILLNGTDQYLPADFLLRQKELHFMPLYELLEKAVRHLQHESD